MSKLLNKEIKQNVIFVDCFNTIILRKTNKRDIFKCWAKNLSATFNVPWKVLYKTYKRENFKLCFKKVFKNFVLQEQFNKVLTKMHNQLQKKHFLLDLPEFIEEATKSYINSEMQVHTYNNNFINFLREQKNNNKKIYIVSDFYCPGDVILTWIKNLEIDDVFDDVFSSHNYNKEKSTTGFYKQLLKDLNYNAKDVLMLGDNLWSDVFMARLCGLHAKRVNNKKVKVYAEE